MSAASVIREFFPLASLLSDLSDRKNVPKCLYQTAKKLVVVNLRTALVTAGWLFLVVTLLATTARAFDVTDEILHLFAPTPLADFRLIEAALHIPTWLIVITGSSACICLQGNVLWATRRTTYAILRSETRLRWIVSGGLLFVGLLSAGTFSIIVTKATVTVAWLDMGKPFEKLFMFKALVRGFQSVFSALFTATIAPMSRRWASQLDQEQKKSVTNLLSWRILLFLHWNILIPTFSSDTLVNIYSFEYLLHVASLLYRLCVITWLFLLVAYTNVSYSQEEQGSLGKSELAMHRSPVPRYAASDPLVTTGGYAPPPPQQGVEMV